ncbi:MAG: CBS domain-containing protein [Saprospiraceae bacterium]
MTAREIADLELRPLTLTQTGRDAFHLMSDLRVRHLPVVDEGRLAGMLSEDDIFGNRLYDTLETLDFSQHAPIVVRANDHVFEAFRLMAQHQLSAVPVLDDEDRYVGLITESDILRCIAELGAFSEQGALVVLRMPKRDYSLAQLARIVEEENAKILSVAVGSLSDPEYMSLTLKINRNDVSRIIASFERFGYEVLESYSALEFDEPMRERYQSFMRYLEV